jgi:polyisoprenoid-binding protein YceI
VPRKLTTPALLVALVMVGCGENPAKDVPKAAVSDPKPLSPKSGQIGGTSSTMTPPASTPADAGKPADPTNSADATKTSPAAPAGTEGFAAPVPLAITPTASKIEFIGSGTAPGKAHHGSFKAFNGVIDLTPGAPGIKQITVDIDTTSLDSDDPKLTGHLKSKDFFEVATYPTSKFITTEIKPSTEKGATHTLVGNLTLHGVTKSITIPVDIKIDGSDVTIKSEFSLDKNDFGMTYGSTPPLIRKEVVIKLNVKGERKG